MTNILEYILILINYSMTFFIVIDLTSSNLVGLGAFCFQKLDLYLLLEFLLEILAAFPKVSSSSKFRERKKIGLLTFWSTTEDNSVGVYPVAVEGSKRKI